MNDAAKFNIENLIDVSAQNNFCGYHVLARRIIHDDNFAVILEKFNQFYQTNWYRDQLAEVVENMHPKQADTMLGLVIQDQRKLGQNLDLYSMSDVYDDFGYDVSVLQINSPELTPEPTADFVPLKESNPAHKRVFVVFQNPVDFGHDFENPQPVVGHYYLFETAANKLDEYTGKCSPDIKHAYEINNSGGKDFIENIKKSVAEIKPNWTIELKKQQIQQDEDLALQLAAEEAQPRGLTFFTNGRTIKDEVKTRIIELQKQEIEYCNNLLKK
jgi:hypothetical protein